MRAILPIATACVFATFADGAAHAQGRPSDARRYRLDGFRVGDTFESIHARAPYDAVCDDDPVDHRTRLFVGYGALPCNGQSFPEGTTFMVILPYRTTDRFRAPIAAVAWFGGTWFETRSSFPVHIGAARNDARARLGRPAGTFALADGREPLDVDRFRGDVFIVSRANAVIGIVLGTMPSDPDNEQWRMIQQGYWRYTVGR
jgi:hypothetical protein